MKKITVVDTDTAELHYLLPVKSNLKKTYPENKIFIKVFINFFDILPTLNKSELMFISLICKNIKPNKNTVAIQLHKHFSKSTLSKITKSLICKNVIVERNCNKVVINHDLFLNGKYITNE